MGKSYAETLRSTAIFGGAQGVLYLVSLLRTKAVALLVGPEGVGAVALYQSCLSLIGTITGLGVAQSGVREVAAAHAAGRAPAVALAVNVLRRACWVTGAAGWGLAMVLAPYLSQWAFGSSRHAADIAILGVTLLIGSVSAGQASIIQGLRRMGDLAKLTLASGLLGTIVAICLYARFGAAGIVPVLVCTAAVQLACSYWFARRIEVPQVASEPVQCWQLARRLVGLGTALMYGALIASIVDLIIRGMVTRQAGLEAAGVYQAAWAISGMFANFILAAMGSDYYPRLAAVAEDNDSFNQIVNEQTEIGVLLAVPGITATLLLAPWLMTIFYSSKFAAASELLPWFALGIFGRVIAWPIGYIQLAKGANRFFAGTQTLAGILHLGLCYLLLGQFGMRGAAIAFAALYALHVVLVLWIARRLSGFQWSTQAAQLLAVAGGWTLAMFTLGAFLVGLTMAAIGLACTLTASLGSLRGLAARLGDQHRLIKWAAGLPGGRLALGI